MLWLAVALGGATGAVARHGLVLLLQGRFRPFPFGVFVVNALGCFVIGLLAGGLAAGRIHVPETMRLFLVVGLLGGFTTFSAYGLDTMVLARSGYAGLALGNAVGQMLAGIGAVWLGFTLAAWRAS